MTAPDLLTIDEVADLLRTPVATLYRWRQHNTGPAGFKVGRRVLYRRADVAAWLDQQERAEQRRHRSLRGIA